MGPAVVYGTETDMKTVNILYDILRVQVALGLLVVQFINIAFMQSQVKISIAVTVIGIILIIQGVHSIRKIRKCTQDL